MYYNLFNQLLRWSQIIHYGSESTYTDKDTFLCIYLICYYKSLKTKLTDWKVYTQSKLSVYNNTPYPASRESNL